MESLSKQIEQWVSENTSWFTSHQLDRAFSLNTRKEKTLRRVIVHNLIKKGKLMSSPSSHGLYKYLGSPKQVDWQS